jgi:hypothetical protein
MKKKLSRWGPITAGSHKNDDELHFSINKERMDSHIFIRKLYDKPLPKGRKEQCQPVESNK